jgi:predicted Zn-dependent peptidase
MGNLCRFYRTVEDTVADELSKLLALKEKGVLTEEEFARLKKNLIGGKN